MTKRKTLDERAHDYANEEWPVRVDGTRVRADFATGMAFGAAYDGWLEGYRAAWREMRRKFGKRTARLRSVAQEK